MFRFFLLVLVSSYMVSCTTEKETKDATFWRKKYESLNAFVKRKGLKKEADEAVKELEKSQAVYCFTVFETHYSLNGIDVQNDLLERTVKSLKGEKAQRINIRTMKDVRHQRLLLLMNELNVQGFKNFHLSCEKNIRPAP